MGRPTLARKSSGKNAASLVWCVPISLGDVAPTKRQATIKKGSALVNNAGFHFVFFLPSP